MEVKHEKLKLKNRFVLIEDKKEIGEMTYEFRRDNIMDINHTFIDEDYRGKDYGHKLVDAAVAFMRKNDIKAIPSCPYVKKVFDEHPKYSDVRL
ncbi:GNAT family N-acetyltransferase [Winogradskyella ursingii]|uniref:GNAT family N-acetyltransferase n=1 Tax=Winogradskyella ursingii TaxID=2686079 RepID=UPI0015C9F65E|nr:GNAT family N-acetyltransferase [Winogradskyella ursingii]